ncbi:MAG: hypothetical protein ACRD6W_02235 [Nitrososphaerales archaeon]
MVDFLEGWVITELCMRFRTIAEALYKEAPEQGLLMVLLEERRPLSLRQISSSGIVSRRQLRKDGRLRRAMERLEESGIVSKSYAHGEETPKYALNRGNATSQLILRVFADRKANGGLVAASLREAFGPGLER